MLSDYFVGGVAIVVAVVGGFGSGFVIANWVLWVL